MSDEYGCVNQIRFQGRSFAGADISNYKIVNTGDIVYTRSPLQAKPFGIIKVVRDETGIVSPLYMVNKAKEGNDAEFIYRIFDLPYKTNNYLSPLVRKGAKNTMNVSETEWLSGDVVVARSYEEQKSIGKYFKAFDDLITLHQREDLTQINPDKDLITISTSLFSNSWMMCRYVFWVVVILACPRRLATLAIETPANNSNEAWVCLKPWIEMTGIFRDKQCLFKISFTVELYTLFCAKIGSSSGKPFKSSENCTTVCQSICIFLTEDLFFVGKKPPSDL